MASAAPQPTSSSGRYQIFFSPHSTAATYLVDTEKGKVWQLTQFTDVYTQPKAFYEIDVIDSDGEIGRPLNDWLSVYKTMEESARNRLEPQPNASASENNR